MEQTIYNNYVKNRKKWYNGELETILTEEEINECETIYYRKKSQKHRAIEHVKAFNGPFLLFGTFTFSNEMLECKKNYRRKYVQRVLKELGIEEYLACIDYGEKNAREHYHFICGSKTPQGKLIRIMRNGRKNVFTHSIEEVEEMEKDHELVQMNSILFKCVNNFEKEKNQIVKYITKVIYYTIKSEEKIIYSRGLDKHYSRDYYIHKADQKHNVDVYKVQRLCKKYHLKGVKPLTMRLKKSDFSHFPILKREIKLRVEMLKKWDL